MKEAEEEEEEEETRALALGPPSNPGSENTPSLSLSSLSTLSLVVFW